VLTYRRQESDENTAAWLRSLRASLALRPSVVSDARDLVIAAGDLETAIVDALHPARDGVDETAAMLRRACGAVSGAFVALLEGKNDDGRSARHQAARLLDSLEASRLPSTVKRRTPEGFSRYCLFPEQYVTAAARLVHELRPVRAVVVGLRSIGATLSSVVEATLRSRRVEVESYTLRPRGHPFERVASAEQSLTEALARWSSNALFVVVDEGPGMSGSSFASAVTLLIELGVPELAIVLMPGWDSDGSGFLSRRASELWSRHRRYVDPFDPSWVGVPSGASRMEVSAGAWRDAPWANGVKPPTVPQHERRKFVVTREGAAPSIVRFAGFERYGSAVRGRAVVLAAAGFSPPVDWFRDGFLAVELVHGRQLQRQAVGRDDLVDHLARYCAFVKKTFVSKTSSDMPALVEMVRVNVLEGLGPGLAEQVDALTLRATSLEPGCTIVDGRMAPHEWLCSGATFVKTDAYDHGDDDFFPGPTDIAWDLAGASVEFALGAAERARLLDGYSHLSGDRGIGERLAFYEVAYLAFRLGYATVAATLAPCDDAEGFRLCSTEYAGRLRRALEESWT
jgi:hypothetical protein